MLKRKALVVGIDYYENSKSLTGCVEDANQVAAVLRSHGDGRANFDVKLMTASDASSAIKRAQLKDQVRALFTDNATEIVLLYFAGHGFVESTDGYLDSSNSRRGDEGLPLSHVLTLANASQARDKIIVLDSCYSGVAGAPSGQATANLSEGLTILAASASDQPARVENGSGVFTTLFVDALKGAAANLVGQISPGSIYAHIDQSLGDWVQRPVFKTNVKTFVSLRDVPAPIALADLKRLAKLFPTPGFQFELDPSFEPEMAGRPEGASPPDPRNTAIFAILQSYNRVNLLKPVDAPHMWHAAIQRKSCQLTVLGEHYRKLVEKGLI